MGKKSRAKASRREQFHSVREGQAAPRSAPAAPPNAPPTGGLPARPRPAPPIPAAALVKASRLAPQVFQFLQQGKPQEGLALLQQTPPSRGEEAGHRNLVALCLVALRQYDGAYPLLVEATSAGGLDLDLNLAMAETELNLGLAAHAERRIRRLAQAYPAHPGVTQAREYARQISEERQSRAERLGVDAAALQEAEYLREQTYLPLREGGTEKVIELARRAIEAEPTYDVPHLTLATALATRGDTQAAIEVLRPLTENLDQVSPQMTASLIRFLVSVGAREEARELGAVLHGRELTPELRPWLAESLAALEEHDALFDLLRSARDLTPREHFLLGTASAHQQQLSIARREIHTALNAGYRDPLAFRASELLERNESELPYFAAGDMGHPATIELLRRVLVSPGEVPAEEVRAALAADPGSEQLLDRLLRQDPPTGLALLGAADTQEARDRLREFAANQVATTADRLIALSYLRDLGEIAEDEPVELSVGDAVHTVVLGRHRITRDRPLEVPDQETARQFEDGLRLMETDPEGAYSGWIDIDNRFPSPAMRVRLAQLAGRLGRMEEMREWLERALEVDPGWLEAHISLAELCLNGGDLRGAIEHARYVEDSPSLTATEFLSYQGIREGLNALLESPIADALMEQADIAPDEETAEASRELAGMLGSLQKSMALTQYLRQRPIANLREDLSLADVMAQMDGTVIYNAAWLFGLLPELEEARERAAEASHEPPEAGAGQDESVDDEEMEEVAEDYPEEVRRDLAARLLDADRLAEGLPGLPDQDLQGLKWLLEQGGAAPLEEYLKQCPPDPDSPSDMVLEYGIVVEGRLGGRVIRMVPKDLREPLGRALGQVLADATQR